jgi:ABC-type multidrug transport system ATPase subunit
LNGARLSEVVLVKKSDAILLAHSVPFPWPDLGDSQRASGTVAPERVELLIGRDPACDFVLDYPQVSWRHARVTVESSGRAFVEDLNSVNGIAINDRRTRVTQSPLAPRDTLFLGSFRIPAAQLIFLPQQKQKRTKGDVKESIEFRGDAMTLGRDPKCDLPLNYPMISWRHAKLLRTPDGYILRDLGSTNGTFVNGKKVAAKSKVMPGQIIGLGTYTFRLTATGSLQKQDLQDNVAIEARNLGFEVIEKGARKPLVEGISLAIHPYELIAVMGVSGAGKTTLLQLLNGYLSPSAGDVLYNGRSLSQNYNQFRLSMGYVPQDDIIHPQLSVYEALWFTAKLRFPSDYSDAQIDERVRQVLETLNLEDAANTRIGSPEKKGISGGQRRRVNIAMELLSEPTVLFLDEPTSGLSSEDAANVVKLLRELSDKGKTVLATIHQPDMEAFRQFDNLLMVSKDLRSPDPGRLVYYGPVYPDAFEFFTPEEFKRSPASATPGKLFANLNPRENGATRRWMSKFSASALKREYIDQRVSSSPPPAHPVPRTKTTRGAGITQLATLALRNFKIKFGDRKQTVILLLQAPLFAVLVATAVGKLAESNDPEEWRRFASNVGAAHFLMVVAAVWFGCNNAAREIVGEWAVYQRERMVNLKLPSYLGSKFVVLGLLCLLQCSIMLAIVKLWCNLACSYPQALFILLVTSLTGVALGLCISSYAPNPESAIGLLPVVLLPMIVFGGGICPLAQMNSGARFLSTAVPSRWAFEANMLLETSHRHGVSLPDMPNQLKALQTQLQELQETDRRIQQGQRETVEKGQQLGAPAKIGLSRTPEGAAKSWDVAEIHFPDKDQRTGFRQSVGLLIVLLTILLVGAGLLLRARDIQ